MWVVDDKMDVRVKGRENKPWGTLKPCDWEDLGTRHLSLTQQVRGKRVLLMKSWKDKLVKCGWNKAWYLN